MKVFLFLLLSFFTTILFAQKTFIYCGQLIDVKKNEIQKEMTIVVQQNKIADVLKGYVTASSTDKTIDLKSKTVMPGLIDMHVHVEMETKKGAVADKFIYYNSLCPKIISLLRSID
jgi:imidazolonepropionase-like amidohydrolase